VNRLAGGKPSSIGAFRREQGILGFTRRYASLAALCPPTRVAGAYFQVLEAASQLGEEVRVRAERVAAHLVGVLVSVIEFRL
jgi:hypothetical protein